ncbi:MAG TPA: DUF3106 domain-containing protein [Candidatus Paceibacterota bacterium]|nr:DUF3106 domain-containing protein [Candidatus Paceibacterota bacterium]
MPAPGSGISLFRELLAMNAGERNRALTNFSPTVRPQILAKVREYESLPPDERELRLRVTELHSYLRPLMTAPTTNRASQLARIPETDRELVEDRLREWDKLSPAVQAELLEHEATLRYLAQIHDRTEEQRRIILTNIPAPRREMLEKGISKWSSMSEDQRRQTLSRFHQFFELTAAEKEKALRTLSGPERRQIEKTLRAFDQLRPDQRAVCLRSLEKFTSLSPAERHRFLKDAERWQQMSPGERQTWRDLVRKMPPPLPTRRPPPPPLPPAARPHRPAPTVATNGS